ncbi:MAG: methyltransferase domain-containing protein [Syntrophales bacterium]|nr:methyltransferase domain-containing protein [Syntrophales bacterium]MDD5641499.1 methyltransferase domain-containing protein [Syntrophales bacterium]
MWSTFFKLWKSGQLKLPMRLMRLMQPVYQAAFLAAAAKQGILRRLAAGPVTLAQLAEDFASDPQSVEALEAWLQVGVKTGELQLDRQGYSLRGKLARDLALEQNDAWVAFLEEGVSLHFNLLRELPERLREHRPFTLADQDGELIARSSRLLEPLVFEAIDGVVPSQGQLRLLEVGCGSGTYIHYAAQRNPELEARGIELQLEVAEMARRNLEAWGLASRANVETGDLRDFSPDPIYDVATLHNNIYYFPTAERVAVLAHLKGFLKPGGRLLLTTSCRGNSIVNGLLNLWGAATVGCGPLPLPTEMQAQLHQAGFKAVTAKKLYPFETYFAFVSTA